MTMDKRPILLVEDNPDDVELTLRAIRKNNIPNEIVVARTGEQAADLLFSDNATAGKPRMPPSIVLLDLKLPGMDGFDVLRLIRSNPLTKLIPVVILTSSREELDLLKGYSLGANSYVRKPVNYDQFVSTVQQLERYWLGINEPVSNKGAI
jgi:CheY-like chemotaxis protein